MVRYVRSPSLEKEFISFDIISSYDFIEINDDRGSYTKIIKDSKDDFEEDLKKNLERKIKETIKPKFHKSSRKKR